jgi:hypothetical protein
MNSYTEGVVEALLSFLSARVSSRLFIACALLSAAFAVTGCSGSSIHASSSSSSALAVSTTSLSSGQVGVAYNATLAATGGVTPYHWTLTVGALPAGLSLNSTSGAITGTPTAAVNATALTFTVADSGSPAQSASVNLTLTIAASAPITPLAITTTTLPNGQAGASYSATLTATGGTAPYRWAITSGSLPSGLLLNAATGAITGAPTAGANNLSVGFTVTDSSSPAQTKTATLTLFISSSGAGVLSITTSLLPNGQAGNAYNAALAATGGTLPYTWSIAIGALPAGLSLNAATGAITGTPTATASASPLTVSVSDSSIPVQTSSANLALTIYSSNGISVSVSPQNTGLAITQALSLTATTTDSDGVNWSVTGSGCSGACGTFSSTTSLSGVAVTYTAPATAGVYTINASSVTNNSITAAAIIGVTDLSGMTTYHNDQARDGANTQEYTLTTSNVATATFGKLFSCPVDEAIYAQPLWVPNLTIGSAKHNVVFVATQNDSLYAFDADSNASPCTPLWQVNLLDAAHGGNAGETSVPAGPGPPAPLVGGGDGDIMPEVGVTGTPVIDLTTDTLYVVSKSVIASGPTFYQRLHAIDLATGNEKFSGPVNIAATFPGDGDNSSTTTFVAQQENQRPGLALVNGVVYVAWASHEDTTPYYGWIIGYSASDLSMQYVFNVDPNAPSSPMIGTAGEGGIWMSGGAPAADAAGNLYVLTANGLFDPTTNDYGDSLLEMSPSLTVNQYFTPTDQATDYQDDKDFGSGGAAVLVDLPANGSNPTHLVVGGGKDGALYVLNRDALGEYGDLNAWQMLTPGNNQIIGSGIFSTGAFWNSTFYLAPVHGPLQAFSLSASTAQLTVLPNVSGNVFGFPGATPSMSSMPDDTQGIVWALDNNTYCTLPYGGGVSAPCGPAVLHAYDATNLSTELWNSTMGTGNTAGYAVKFTVPTVANGKVYVGTRGNNTGGPDNSTSTPGELDVYGLLPN